MGSFKGKLFNPGLSATVQEIQSNDIGMKRSYFETYQVLQHATLDIIKLIPNSFMYFFCVKTWMQHGLVIWIFQRISWIWIY